MLLTAREDTEPHGSQAPYERLLRLALLGIAKDRRYAVPSAGALYPYEIDLVLQTARGRDALSALTLPALAARLAAIGAQDLDGLTMTLWFRPTVSVGKYGERGIIYGVQDCGHLLANLVIAARAMGLVCKSTIFPFATPFEKPQPLPARIAIATLEIGPGDGTSSRGTSDHHGTQLLAAMMRRRSASAFAGPVNPPDIVERVLHTAQAMREGSLGEDMRFRFHLARRGPSGTWRVSAAPTLPDLLAAPHRDASLDMTSLFCLQEFTAQAGEMLTISAKLGSGTEVLQQSLALGGLGQCLYLAAEMHGCAACCVGGFDYDAVRQAVFVPDGRYAAYAMVFGLHGPPQRKVDRTSNPTPRSAIIPLLLPETTDAQP